MIRFTQQPFALNKPQAISSSYLPRNTYFQDRSRVRESFQDNERHHPLSSESLSPKNERDYFWIKLLLFVIGGLFFYFLWEKYSSSAKRKLGENKHFGAEAALFAVET